MQWHFRRDKLDIACLQPVRFPRSVSYRAKDRHNVRLARIALLCLDVPKGFSIEAIAFLR
jgi:hypothetical protein